MDKLKYFIWFIAGIIVTGTLIVSAAPTFRLERSLHPETDSTYDLGTSTRRWLNIFSDFASTSNMLVETAFVANTSSSTFAGTLNLGTASTSAFYQSGFTTCSDPTNSKVLWNSTTGKFTCGTDQNTGVGGGGASPDWQKETNFGVLTLTPTTTIPIWAKSSIFASSTLTVNGLASMASITATGTLDVTGLSTFAGFLSTASSTINGNATTTGGIGTLRGFYVNGSSVLNSNTLGSGILASSLTSVGTLSALTANGVVDFGGATSLEIPNGAGNTLSQIGQIAFDTTDNQLLIATTTTNTPVVIPTMKQLWAATVASTSVDFVSGGRIPMPIKRDGVVIREIHCSVDTGTSVVINVSNLAGTADTETVTCDTDTASDTDITSNSVVVAGAQQSLEVGSIVGSVDYLSFSIWGTIQRE